MRLTFYPNSIRYIDRKTLAPALESSSEGTEIPPPGTVKSILPCTPLGVVKSLERLGVYNTVLKYGDRAYGKTITVINRFALAQSLNRRCVKVL